MYALGGHFDLKKLEGYGRKQTNSLIEAGKTAMIFSVFTEKRKNAGLSLKSCAEYTKINDKFNRGFHGSTASRRQSGVERPGTALALRFNAKSVGRKGRPLRPLLVTPKGEHASFSGRSGAPFFQIAGVYSSKV